MCQRTWWFYFFFKAMAMDWASKAPMTMGNFFRRQLIQELQAPF
jgi:hypothetical protein